MLLSTDPESGQFVDWLTFGFSFLGWLLSVAIAAVLALFLKSWFGMRFQRWTARVEVLVVPTHILQGPARQFQKPVPGLVISLRLINPSMTDLRLKIPIVTGRNDSTWRRWRHKLWPGASGFVALKTGVASSTSFILNDTTPIDFKQILNDSIGIGDQMEYRAEFRTKNRLDRFLEDSWTEIGFVDRFHVFYGMPRRVLEVELEKMLPQTAWGHD